LLLFLSNVDHLRVCFYSQCILTSWELGGMEKKSMPGFTMQIQRFGAGLYFWILGLV